MTARSYPQMPMVDLLADEPATPDQPPTLSPLEAARAEAVFERRVVTQWLMTSEAPDFAEVLAELVNRPAWHSEALCAGLGADLFFPVRGESTVAAKAICAACPVQSECLHPAMGAGDRFGIWGGLSERGRRVLRRGAA